MSQNISRRAVTQGVVWATPAVALAVNAPAASTSPDCALAIDRAFASRLCNGKPVTLELNFYQPAAALNGFQVAAYINVKNLSDCTLEYTAKNPLVFDIQVRNNNVVNDARRSIIGISSSWDDLSVSRGNVTHYNVANKPVGSVSTSVVWDLSGPGYDTHTPGQEADFVLRFGDGLAGGRRWNNYLTITPRPFGLPAPSFEETGAPRTPECRAYYDQKLKDWVTGGSVRWVARGPKTTIDLASGKTLDSRDIRNYSSVEGSDSTDGIW